MIPSERTSPRCSANATAIASAWTSRPKNRTGAGVVPRCRIPADHVPRRYGFFADGASGSVGRRWCAVRLRVRCARESHPRSRRAAHARVDPTFLRGISCVGGAHGCRTPASIRQLSSGRSPAASGSARNLAPSPLASRRFPTLLAETHVDANVPRTLDQVGRAELIADEHFYRSLCALTARVKRRPH
jgi:hypothetical protein